MPHPLSVLFAALVAAGVASPSPPPPAIVAVPSNPVTVALAGDVVYEVGPGKTYTHPNQVPWGMIKGDANDGLGKVVVNIWPNTGGAPYTGVKFGIAGRGSASKWIWLNGITDASGNRPIFDFVGATTSAECQKAGSGGIDVFNAAAPTAGEDYAYMHVKYPAAGGSWRPGNIVWQNIEWQNDNQGQNYTSLAGSTRAHGGGALRGDRADNVWVYNCVAHDCTMACFTQSANNDTNYTNTGWRFYYCRFFNNGFTGSAVVHGLYLQGYNFVIEGCYLGRNRTGSQGSTLKTRLGKSIVRYCWIESSLRLWDNVHPEDQDGPLGFTAVYPDFSDSFGYGNVFVNDYTDTSGSGPSFRAIHFGNDNNGEADTTTSPGPFATDLKRFFFFSNTYITVTDGDPGRRLYLFQLQTAYQDLYAWNNVFAIYGSGPILDIGWSTYAGTIHLLGGNVVYQQVDTDLAVTSGSGTAVGAFDTPAGRPVLQCTVAPITSAPLFIDRPGYDFDVVAGSSTINGGVALPTASLPSDIVSALSAMTVDYSPRKRSNGLIVRVGVAAMDVGAYELDVSVPVLSGTSTVTGTDSGAGSVFDASGFSATVPSGHSVSWAYQWLRDGSAISGATSATYTHAGSADYGHQLARRDTATNTTTGRTATATSTARMLTADPLAPTVITAPAITGQAFVNGTLTCSDGTYGNNTGLSLAKSWRRGSAGGTVVGTGNTHVCVAGDEGAVIYCVVTASNSLTASTTTTVVGPTATIGPVQPLEPDTGLLFNALDDSSAAYANGTTMAQLNSGVVNGGYVEVQSGNLQCIAGRGTFGDQLVLGFETSTDDQTLEFTVPVGGLGSGAELITLLQCSTPNTDGYYCRWTPTQVHTYTSGTQGSFNASYSHGINVATTALRARHRIIGNTLSWQVWTGSAWSTLGSASITGTRLTGGKRGASWQPGATVANTKVQSLQL